MRVVNNMRFGLIYIQCSHLTASVCKCKNNHARARIIIRGTIIHTLVSAVCAFCSARKFSQGYKVQCVRSQKSEKHGARTSENPQEVYKYIYNKKRFSQRGLMFSAYLSVLRPGKATALMQIEN
jgi:hypothetical protein